MEGRGGEEGVNGKEGWQALSTRQSAVGFCLVGIYNVSL